ncbi:S66 peptidase family protein [Cellulomonas cellasea]|uniref:Muramoyltetrapeptide carboxypeptidase LdcA involved in peptidoglycan recycling n=1 Tax=Cellulomonas cellasea TaxID=43670 RepID=A0A7W4UBK2_9CELL|nr:S66 peptidase family protein [Cellulomonas cellasea]MBB2921186.1 muramoyltetrapeptide carboxypeptidase LdcA involved in peptidoglycan recycling [Cellulomonas cellasea]
MTPRYPDPLAPGDRIAVTAPSAGVAPRHRARLDHAVATLESRGYEVVLGECLDGSGPVSAPAAQRAAELTAMLVDPAVRAVVPPWGGVLAIDLVRLLDWDAIAAARPTWFVGFSDTATLLTAMTLRTGVATVHGPNLMDVPYATPAPLLSWLDVVEAPTGTPLHQGPSALHVGGGWDDFAAAPTVDRYTLDTPTAWVRLDGGADDVVARGRLVGGCLETVTHLVGSPYGDVPAFVREHAPEGVVVYVEASEDNAFGAARRLHGLRLAGWFDDASAVLVGRTNAPDSPGFTQHDAVRDALGDLGVPVVADVDCGHVPPQMTLVNGALATLTWRGDERSLVQELA